MTRRQGVFLAGCVVSVIGWGLLLGPAAAAAALGMCLIYAALA